MKLTKNYTTLFKNVGIFAIANFSTKILSFLILPLYTYYLTPAEYGTIDLVNMTIQLLFSILSLSIVDALLRFTVFDEKNRNKCFTISLKIILLGIIPILIGCMFVYPILKDINIIIFFILVYFLQALNTLFGTFAKAINKTKEMALISTISSVSILVLNVYFVAVLKNGMNGYWIATILGNLIGIVLYISICKLHQYIELKVKDKEMLKNMLIYSIPLIPNALFWWINSSLDRWALNVMTNISIVGLYSCANKIPTILSTINSIFSQAWNLSLFQNENENERKKFFKTTYYYFNQSLLICTLGIIILSKFIATIMFSNEFFQSWNLVPLLTFGVYINSLNSFLGSMFTAEKKTSYIFTTTVVGSIVNIVLNFVLINYLGAVGAAIATLFSYLAVWIMRSIKIRGNFKINVNIKSILIDFIFVTVITILIMSDKAWLLAFILTFIYIIKIGIVIFKNKTLKEKNI